MKRNVFYSAGILGVFCMLLIGCVSIETERPFTEIYAGEEEQLLGGTRWELFDLKSSDNFSMIVEFHVDGTLSCITFPTVLMASSLKKAHGKETAMILFLTHIIAFAFMKAKLTKLMRT